MATMLVDTGYRIIGLDNKQTAGSQIDVFLGDLRSSDDMCQIIREANPKYVLHLAAVTEREESYPETLYKTNVYGTLNLFNAITKFAPDAKVCVVGSSAEYGLTDPNDCPIVEDHPLRPVTLYGISKVAQSLVAQRAWLIENLHVTRTRTFNLIGPGQPDSFAPSTFAFQVAKAEAGLIPPEIMTHRLSDYRDYIDIRDAARAYWAIVKNGKPGIIYNVCSGRAVQIFEIVDILLHYSNIKLSVRIDDKSDTASIVPFQFGSNELLAEHTNWKPEIDIEQSVYDLLVYWRQFVRNYGSK